jgi:hypothetical protein
VPRYAIGLRRERPSSTGRWAGPERRVVTTGAGSAATTDRSRPSLS